MSKFEFIVSDDVELSEVEPTRLPPSNRAKFDIVAGNTIKPCNDLYVEVQSMSDDFVTLQRLPSLIDTFLETNVVSEQSSVRVHTYNSRSMCVTSLLQLDPVVCRFDVFESGSHVPMFNVRISVEAAASVWMSVAASLQDARINDFLIDALQKRLQKFYDGLFLLILRAQSPKRMMYIQGLDNSIIEQMTSQFSESNCRFLCHPVNYRSLTALSTLQTIVSTEIDQNEIYLISQPSFGTVVVTDCKVNVTQSLSSLMYTATMTRSIGLLITDNFVKCRITNG
jgi:hypothetical protein